MLDASDAADIRLALRSDPPSVHEGGRTFHQHFDFTVTAETAGDKLPALGIRIANADVAMCGFEGYQACYSLGDGWRRAADTRVGEASDLLFSVPAEGARQAHVAYFVPYGADLHAALVARAVASPRCRVGSVGRSVEGREIELVAVGSGARRVWVVCRQHPAETMAEWWADGFLGRLLGAGSADRERDAVLEGSTVLVVIRANPDGAVKGLTRTNAAGMNLNREWTTAGDESPEVQGIRARMEAGGGCDLMIDVHGDEGLARPVLCCAPAWTPRLEGLQLRFWRRLAELNPDFDLEGSLPHLIRMPPADAPAAQDKLGPDRLDRMGETGPNLTLASTFAGARWDCLAMTLEQCFLPPWSADKSAALGGDFVAAIADILPHLRGAQRV